MALSEETSSIPLVDISPILSPTSTPRAREDVIKQLSSASQKYGFFQLTGHGIPLFHQREILLCSKRLFSLPLSQKQEKAMSRSPGLSKRGYEAIGGQKLASIPDTKEGFYIGVETPADDPKAGSFLTGPNFWPEGLRDDEFREPVMAYHEQVLELHESLLRILAEGLEGGVGLFDDFMVDPVANIKLLHYPPTASENQAEVPLGAGSHTDFGLLNILLQQPDHPGLEVLSQDKTWIPVPATEDVLIVNIGDVLQKFTEGNFRSAVHRVVNVGLGDRYSVPFFYHGNLKAKTRRGKGKETIEEHILGRFRATFGS